MAETNGASRAGLYLSIATSVIVLLGAVGSIFYIGFKVQANSDEVDILVRRIATLETSLALSQDRLTKIEVSLNEVETQFCSQDVVRNLMHANDLRNISLLWDKTFGTRYPTDNAFYPTICNRRVKQ